jgi:GNAT superfamily N-acetyltransferase
MHQRSDPSELEVHPLTPDRWPDMVALFGDRGDPSWCWCSWQRVPPGEHGRGAAELSRERLRIAAGLQPGPGLVAYARGEPAGWVSVAPRAAFPGIAGGDADPDDGIWAISCFVVHRTARRRGVARALLDAAITYARERGARILEGYPVEVEGPKGSAQLWTGVRSMFDAAGFEERGRFEQWSAVPAATGPHPRKVGRPPGRPVMRLELG